MKKFNQKRRSLFWSGSSFLALSLFGLAYLSILTPVCAAELTRAAERVPVDVDPMEELDSFFGYLPVEQAFHLGTRIRWVNESCVTAGICDSFETLNQVDAITQANVMISTYSGNQKKGEQKLTSADWDKNHGNLVRAYIAKLNSFGFKINETSLSPTTYSLRVGGQTRELIAREVRVSGANGAGIGLQARLIAVRDLGGLGQLVLREETRLGALGGVERFHVAEYTP